MPEDTDALVTFAETAAARDAAERARREEMVVRLAETFDRTRFAALWFVARERRDSTRRGRTPRPSHANIDAAWSDGYLEGLRDAACAVMGCDPFELFQALENATEGLDYYAARNVVVRHQPRMTVALKLGL